MKSNPEPVLMVNGWAIFAHPLFLEQVETLGKEVERLRAKDPRGYTKKNAAKRLAAVLYLAFEAIPQDPTRHEYRQGVTLGPENRHWFRAKFFQQYRLFFRYHSESKILVLAWVNDQDTLRAYESDQDAYLVFKKMLGSGHPPNDWTSLLEEAKAHHQRTRHLRP
jgi:toxin YhaV